MKKLLLAGALALATTVPAMARPTSLYVIGTIHGRIPATASGAFVQAFPNRADCDAVQRNPADRKKLHKLMWEMTWGVVDQPGYGWASFCRPSSGHDLMMEGLRQRLVP